jgi:hypothetical protein
MDLPKSSRFLAVSITVGLLFCATAGAVHAQIVLPPERGEHIVSMGQPAIWKPYWAPMAVWNRTEVERGGWELLGGVYRDIANPSFGALGLAGEAYFRSLEDNNDAGLRIFANSPFFGLQAGADYGFRHNELDFVMSLSFAWRRSGPLGRGDLFRIDYYPGRDNSFSFGLSIPLGSRKAGKTRPQRDAVELAKVPDPEPPVFEPGAELLRSLDLVRETSDIINRFTTPFIDQDSDTDKAHMESFTEMLVEARDFIGSTDETYPDGRNFTAVTGIYHREIERAFTLTAEVETQKGAEIAAAARGILLHEVVFPYDRLLGQRKRRDSLLGFGVRAEEVFAAWLYTSSDIPPPRHPAIMYVFRRLIDFWEENRKAKKYQLSDSRLVWIPLHYVIKPEESDTQSELNAILEAAVEQDLTHANDVHYIINELFQHELYRMIHAARDYHVLWIHDYRGRNGAGNPDEIGFTQTVYGYIGALTNRVREYEQTRKIPTYIIMLDEFYYEANDGRLWMSLLENPLDHKVVLGDGYEEWEKKIEAMQDSLRMAVEASPTLQAGKRRYGEKWLKNKIKVHVNNTNPADMSFRSNYLFEWLPFIPDILLRDHRKISFYDVTEMDPGEGEAIFTGMGVGEHYSGPTWDDRAILVRGPALVDLKDAAREVLLSQGFQDGEVPPPLRQLPKPSNYDDMLLQLNKQGWNASAMQVHNASGYGMKWSNMLKGTIYNLMPSGTHMYIPDSLWNSALWAGMMTGAALRGCRVFPISPSLANAPSDGLPQMTRANEMFTRLVLIQNELREQIEDAGGMLRVGIYNADYGVADAANNMKTFKEGAAKSELLHKIFPFDPSVYEAILDIADKAIAEGEQTQYLAEDVEERKPKLHLKSQFFISGELVSSLIPKKEWKPVVETYLYARRQQVQARDNYVDAKNLRYQLEGASEGLSETWLNTISEEQREKAFVFLTVGSHNMDYRGKIMDAEVSVVVAGQDALIAYLDFFGILARTTWIETVDQVDELLPSQSGVKLWMSRFVKNAL